MRVERVDRAGFAALSAEWDALVAARRDPFGSAEWIACWWDAFGGSADDAFALVARRDGELAGGLPLLRDGRRLCAMVNDHTPLFRVVAADEEARRALLDAALSAAPGGLRLPAVPSDDEVARGGYAPLRATRPAAVAPIVDTTGPFEAWRAESKQRWGAPLERFRRKMGREHELEIVVNRTPDDLEDELRRGFAVEGSGWKARAGTAIVSSPETERFYRDIAHAFAGRGELACSSLSLDGRMVAWDLSLLHSHRVWLLKTGFDEEHRRFAPGLVLRLSVIEDCFERGLEAHELLGSIDHWKSKFATSQRSQVDLDLFGLRPRGVAAWATRRGRLVAAAALQRSGLRQWSRRQHPVPG